jgi:Ca2+-binding EF-hand superfamily protein
MDAFKLFDEQNEGYITMNEFKQIMTTMSETLEAYEVEELIRLSDLKGDGKVYYEGLCDRIMKK